MYIATGQPRELSGDTSHHTHANNHLKTPAGSSSSPTSPTGQDPRATTTISKDAHGGDRRYVALRSSADKSMFIAVSSNTLYLWRLRPHVLIGQVVRSELTVQEDGENMDVFWKPDATAVAVITSKGYLHFYDISNVGPKSFGFHFAAGHHFVIGPGLGDGIPQVSIQFRMALEIDTGIQCGVGLDKELMLCTQISPALLSLTWDGIVRPNSTTTLIDIPFQKDGDLALYQLTTNTTQDIFSWIDASGKAYLAQRMVKDVEEFHDDDDDEEAEPSEDVEGTTWVGLCFFNIDNENKPATCLAINSRHLLIAVGTLDGLVFVYSLSDDRSELRVSYVNRLPQLYGDTRGAVVTMEWSSDGYALAVGWSRGEVAVFSLFGALLTHFQLEVELPKGAHPDISTISTLFWCAGNFELTIGSHKEREPMITVVEFMKSPLIRCPNIANINHTCFISEDRILLFDSSDDLLDPANHQLDQFHWIQIPIAYLSSNWPIEYVTFNSTGTSLAVAGKHGFAHYNLQTGRWKLFANEVHEQEIRVEGGVVWLGDHLVVATKESEHREPQLMWVHRNDSLDASTLRSRGLQYPVVAMNNWRENLLVYSVDNVLRHFRLVKEETATDDGGGGTGTVVVDLHITQQIVLDGVIFNPNAVQAIGWNLEHSSLPELKVEMLPVFFLRSGELSVFHDMHGVWEQTVISENVEYFCYICNGKARNMLWAISGTRLQVWMEQALNSLYPRNEMMQFVLDFYPLSINIKHGIVLGTEHQLVHQAQLGTKKFGFVNKMQLIIVDIICHYLSTCDQENGKEALANAMADGYSHLTPFQFALEMMLNRCLEQEDSGNYPEGTLTRAFELTRRHRQYLDVVANCARKLDASLWSKYFGASEPPEVLFNESLECGHLQAAASFLVVLGTMSTSSTSITLGESSSRDIAKYSQLLIQKAIQFGDDQTRREVERFVNGLLL